MGQHDPPALPFRKALHVRVRHASKREQAIRIAGGRTPRLRAQGSQSCDGCGGGPRRRRGAEHGSCCRSRRRQQRRRIVWRRRRRWWPSRRRCACLLGPQAEHPSLADELRVGGQRAAGRRMHLFAQACQQVGVCGQGHELQALGRASALHALPLRQPARKAQHGALVQQRGGERTRHLRVQLRGGLRGRSCTRAVPPPVGDAPAPCLPSRRARCSAKTAAADPLQSRTAAAAAATTAAQLWPPLRRRLARRAGSDITRPPASAAAERTP